MYVCMCVWGLSPPEQLNRILEKNIKSGFFISFSENLEKINTKYLKQKSSNAGNKKLPIQMIVTKVIFNSQIVAGVTFKTHLMFDVKV